MKFLWIAVVAGILALGAMQAHADALQWQVPYFGTVNLNLSTTEALVGYDAILRQSIGGASLPIWTDPKNIVALQVGAVGAWPNQNGAGVEPYIAAGHDILREIPVLAQFKSCHVNVFGRWASEQGKAGVGVSFSYSFAQ
jgi:hypothetical protein